MAKKPSSSGPSNPDYKRLTSLSRAMERAVTVDVAKGIQTFKRKVDIGPLQRAFNTGRYEDIVTKIPWAKLEGDLAGGMGKVGQHLGRVQESAAGALPPVVRDQLRLDVRNTQLNRYIAQRTGALITTSEEGMLEVVRRATAKAFTDARTPAEVAETIKGSIGLNARQGVALVNYKAALAQQGASPKEITKLGDAYYDRLLQQRATMIARTELAFANTSGQALVWAKAADEGLIPEKTQRMWVVDGNPCVELCKPMRGEVTGIAEPWILPDDRAVAVCTESHPHCLCTESLLL